MNVSHVTRRNKARNIYGWVMPHIRMSGDALPDTRTNSLFRLVSHISRGHVTHTDGCCHTVESSASHVWIRHVTRSNPSCHARQYVMSHIWMSHVTHIIESCHTHEWAEIPIRDTRKPSPTPMAGAKISRAQISRASMSEVIISSFINGHASQTYIENSLFRQHQLRQPMFPALLC